MGKLEVSEIISDNLVFSKRIRDKFFVSAYFRNNILLRLNPSRYLLKIILTVSAFLLSMVICPLSLLKNHMVLCKFFPNNYTNTVKKHANKRTAFVIDGSYVTKPYSEKLEGLALVRDGSTGELEK